MSSRRISISTLLALAALLSAPFAPAQKAERPDRAERVKDKDKDKDKDKNRDRESKKPAASGASSKTSAVSTSSAATSDAPRSPGDFDAFRVIADRNIFNPNRTRARGPEEVPPKVDTVALVGIVHDEGKIVAVFDSPDENYRKALKVGETIADFSVTKIAEDHIELSGKDGKPFTFRMSQQLRRVEGGEWRTTGRDFVRTESSRDRTAKETPAIPSDASAVLRRLMEQRQKQLTQ